MKRSLLELALRELAPLVSTPEVIMIGSQCIHAITDTPPAEVIMSIETDILLDEDEVSARIDEALGKGSPFEAEHGVHVDTVPASFPFLPPGYETRLTTIDVGVLRARCLEIHDLVLSKLAAGRLKDTETIAALIHYKLANVDVIRERIAEVPDLHFRAILLARLQLVLENIR